MTLAFQPSCPPSVSGDDVVVTVMIAVQFDDQAPLGTEEIHNEGAEGSLSAEADIVQSAPPET